MMKRFVWLLPVLLVGSIWADEVGSVPLPPRDKPGANRDLALIQQDLESRDLSKVKVVFLGDSITSRWTRNPQNGLKLWTKYFEGDPYYALNLGVRGDETGHMLYRIDEMRQLDGLHPDWVVLHAGVNNIIRGKQAVPQAVNGILAVVRRIHEKLPQARVMVIGIMLTDYSAPKINAQLTQLADRNDFLYVDMTGDVCNADGTLKKELFADGPHPNEAGYTLLAQRIVDVLEGESETGESSSQTSSMR